ncbi:helix-turn-helix domain-containing protein [Nitrosomonas sp. Nm166]|uniref:helix-turn-helix domain-containing protein n=1 Tax=Nitrosomonas sp. Nm166 TaxID=1881054 RepID=UPI000B86DF97|nr:helix-turn-helix domain-containing protein [Nitrosomonas sp. Nm166]
MLKKPASKKDWHHADIIAAACRKEINLQKLSPLFDWSRSALSCTLYCPSPKYERLIAEYLGVSLKQTGQPLPRSR